MINSWLHKVFKGGVLGVWQEKLAMTLQNGKTPETDLIGFKALTDDSDAL